MRNLRPSRQGLYDPMNEHDNCGIGFVANIKGKKSYEIITRGLEVLCNMEHRGARGADNVSGDGAGILMQVPHNFYKKIGIKLPLPGKYGTGLIFLPQDEAEEKFCIEVLIQILEEEGLEFLQLRDVPTDTNAIGEIARQSEPVIKQIFVGGNYEQDDLERRLYLARKQAESYVRATKMKEKEMFYIPSLSSKVLVYKGMFASDQLGKYFGDLQDPRMESAIAMVHSRFSTNTFPSWDLAQPFRIVAHNGEINTIKGNRLWMQARESLLKSELYGEDIKKLFPVVEPNKSDSASFDNVLEFLFLTGRSLPHALSMMVPESWNEKNPIPDSLKAFYEYHSTFMEPWDGPASLVFSDGRYIGGTLDRNGLRPSRYVITQDDMIVMGSEVGIQNFKAEEIKEKGRLRPGKLLLVDTQLGIIIPDQEVKSQLTYRNPYQNWLKENRLDLKAIPVEKRMPSDIGDHFEVCKDVFGYSKEDFERIILPMATGGQEPVGSMGNDSPIPALSEKPHLLFNYFRQLFAQVTNPPIDSIRENLVMDLTNYIGAVQKNLLDETPQHCKLIRFKSPLITNTDLGKIKKLRHEEFRHATLDMLFKAADNGQGLEDALDSLCKLAEKAVDDQKNYIILTDRNVRKTMAPIPVLLAVAAVHHHLIKKRKRMQIGLVVETGEAREVNHFALLIAYGASVINPYMSYAVIDKLVKEGRISLEYKSARKNYIKSVDKGLLKVMSKMGISTIGSYLGAQIYEALGISNDVISKYFTGTASRIGGVGLKEISEEMLCHHKKAFTEKNPFENQDLLTNNGSIHYRKNGEKHSWNPESIGLLQWSTRTNNYAKYKEYSKLVDTETRNPNFLRGYFDFKSNPIDITEVEAIENIMKRFCTGAMSYGSISKEAHEALAIAMNKIGGRSNTGEGGESSKRFFSSARSSIKQIASGRFGVNTGYLVNADELQIKVAQGAKPGEGGQLPGFKVDKIIAKLRNSTPGITLISPPPHHDIYSIEDLAQLIYDLKNVNPTACVSVKLVSENGVGTVAAGVAKANADLIVISGAEGGTGASPLSSIKNAGLPVELGLAEAQQTLVLNDLRGRIKLQTDGQLKTGRDIVSMALLGAEEFGFATSALVVLGCVMMRKCHLNTCPVGIATQNKELREKFLGRSEWVVNFFTFLAEECRELMAELGVRKFDDLVGRSDLLVKRKDIKKWKADTVDIQNLLHLPETDGHELCGVNATIKSIGEVLDHELIKQAEKALHDGEKVWIDSKIKNTDRTTGAMLSGKVAALKPKRELEEDTIYCRFRGSAGQSFAAFLEKGITFKLEGDSNDYFGKGLSGGKIVVQPPNKTIFKPEKQIIIGNTAMYGATNGEAYIRGMAGERFCVRNSGAKAVVEGVGDHGCEYMTGGRVVILGPTGRNFAAGMSGGIAYVLNMEGQLDYFCNQSLVSLEPVENLQDIHELQGMIHQHLLLTQSSVASKVLTHWEEYLPHFVKVIPYEYKKVLEEKKLKKIRRKLKQAQSQTEVHE
ncbi:glutamate synthase large subunit [Marinifilum flexuosum]|uniref:Glutamate synthase [NADPH] large chain n=1 Tax=Marinifilum flexuosum TaxID=1117708 RepID=A0A419WT91_9BACT|nr:glutamate synthase large subunit [Marinifilum flexuosum]RKD98704.1 glutamate synthase (NADPH/NADH) large chain [Marinifilum flexuosum]